MAVVLAACCCCLLVLLAGPGSSVEVQELSSGQGLTADLHQSSPSPEASTLPDILSLDEDSTPGHKAAPVREAPPSPEPFPGQDGATAAALRSDPCASSADNCSECLRHPECAWCSQQNFPRGVARCNPASVLRDSGCSQDAIEDPQSRIEEIRPVDKAGSDVQFQPGEVRLSLRPGSKQTFTVHYRQAEDYPVDLYYLMDLTHSMKEHKERVAELADDLVQNMLNVTKNFRLGFGSFIDKVVLPYVDTTPARLQNPCHDSECEPPYGFHHQLALTSNSSLFTEKVSSAGLSGNLDNAEGGFDAIMQAVVCKEAIGWSQRSRKILLFATDSIFHSAGDGLLGGAIKRNDEQCHLDDEGFYSESTDQDYPSLSQIVRVVQQNKINLIFAVPEKASAVYDALSSFIDGSSVGTLAGDSSNIVQLVRDQYYKIRSEVVLKDNAPDFLKVSYKSSCLRGSSSKGLTNACDGIRVGDEIEFQVTVELERCPSDDVQGGQSTAFRISPVGVNEYVQVRLEPLCRCACQDVVEANSSSCSGRWQRGVRRLRLRDQLLRQALRVPGQPAGAAHGALPEGQLECRAVFTSRRLRLWRVQVLRSTRRPRRPRVRPVVRVRHLLVRARLRGPRVRRARPGRVLRRRVPVPARLAGRRLRVSRGHRDVRGAAGLRQRPPVLGPRGLRVRPMRVPRRRPGTLRRTLLPGLRGLRGSVFRVPQLRPVRRLPVRRAERGRVPPQLQLADHRARGQRRSHGS
ncbi:integrin beta pat-3-like [Dermacentor silvarum]|uniref:integrin beta pat-3-like n=1 Tax=Dermacentor silvarum TaxID=543639 RepID=UPI0021017AAD|nr:integrin beta pat-3-like [Dermacentor silvarum]